MNCSACGGPLQFNRVVFRCSCGAYIHAYCVDRHVIESHRPELEEGYADLNGEFHPKHEPVASQPVLQGTDTTPADRAQDQHSGDDDEAEEPSEDLVPGEAVLDESHDEIDEESDVDR